MKVFSVDRVLIVSLDFSHFPFMFYLYVVFFLFQIGLFCVCWRFNSHYGYYTLYLSLQSCNFGHC